MTLTRLAASLGLASSLGLAACGGTAPRDDAVAGYPPEGRLIEVAGRTVHAVVRGSGPDVVLIHGASGNARDFTFAFMDRLARRYRVIAFDRPGLGYTDRARASYDSVFTTAAESPAEQARLLQAAAAQLGARKPVVLGHSYGGSVALAWALERPRNVAALVVVSGASNPWPGELARFYRVNGSLLGGVAVVPLLAAAASRDRVATAVASIFAPQRVPRGYIEHIGVPLSLRPASVRANARQVNTLRPHLAEMSKRYGGIGVPVEIVHGDADDVVPLQVHSQPLSRQIPGARLTVLPGIGHMPHHVAPDAVAAAVDRAARRAGLR